MKLYPCQKIAMAEMDESSDKTNAGVWTYKLRCRAAGKTISRQRVPKYNTLSGTKSWEYAKLAESEENNE